MAEATIPPPPNVNFQTQFYGFFDNLSPGKKLSMVFAIVLVLIGLGFIFYNSQQETYALFMNGMSPKETSTVVSKLNESQIKYKIQPGGAGVLVEATQLDQARLEIASSNILAGNVVGFEIFDKSDFTATEFEQNVRYRRALEGELSRLVQKIQFIDTAKVIIAMPRRSVFVSEDKIPTASVQISLKSGEALSPKATKTIAYLISSAVPEMKPGNVQISDQYGNLYSGNSPEDISSEVRDENLKYKSEFELYLTQKLLTQLEKIAGTGHVEVRVSADINFNESSIEESVVDPDSSTLISEENISESSAGSRSIPVGIPGVTSNSPEIQAGSAEVANVSDYNKKHRKSNYENSKKYVKQTISSGNIEKLNVSILIDDKQITRVNEQGQGVDELVKWSDEEKNEISQIARRTIGFNEERGDRIEVTNLSFTVKKEADKVLTTEQQLIEKEFWIDIIKYLFFTVVLVALILVVVRPMTKRLFSESDDLNLVMGLPTTVGDFEGGAKNKGGGGADKPDDLFNMANNEKETSLEIPSRNRILELAKEDPQKTANMVRFWLKDKATAK